MRAETRPAGGRIDGGRKLGEWLCILPWRLLPVGPDFNSFVHTSIGTPLNEAYATYVLASVRPL